MREWGYDKGLTRVIGTVNTADRARKHSDTVRKGHSIIEKMFGRKKSSSSGGGKISSSNDKTHAGGTFSSTGNVAGYKRNKGGRVTGYSNAKVRKATGYRKSNMGKVAAVRNSASRFLSGR